MEIKQTSIHEQETPFLIYRDGEVVRPYLYRVQAERFLRGLGHVMQQGAGLAAQALKHAADPHNVVS